MCSLPGVLSYSCDRCSFQQLQVPTLDLGELLIRCIYQAQPQLEQCSQAQLLQLVTLADKFGAAAVPDLAGKQLQLLAADPAGELEWDTAMHIYSLPTGCPELETFKPLYPAAARRVQKELYDLEDACQPGGAWASCCSCRT
jgi:hypothetical protein